MTLHPSASENTCCNFFGFAVTPHPKLDFHHSSLRCSIVVCSLLSPSCPDDDVANPWVELCLERKGQKWEQERNEKERFSFLSRFLHFLEPLFFPFLAKIMKNRWKRRRNGEKTARKMGKEATGLFLPLSRFSNLARFCFTYRSSNPFLSLSRPVLGLSYTTHLSYLDTCDFQPNHWTTSNHRRSADQWEVCICSEELLGNSLRDMFAPSHGSKQSDAVKKARAQGAVACQEGKKTQHARQKEGKGRRERDPIATNSSRRVFTGIVGTASMR